MKSPVQLFIAMAILLATATVAAQVYKWVDKDGKVQYTDTPPPASATKTEAKKLDMAPAAAPAASAPGKSLADRAKDFDKRKADDAEKQKKAEADQKNADIKAANCKDAKSNLAALESGRPMARTTDTGGREVLSDEARQADIATARKAAEDFCK
jgi:hypothetical protein